MSVMAILGRGEVPEPGGCEQDAADTEAEEPPHSQPERLPGPRGHRLNLECAPVHVFTSF